MTPCPFCSHEGRYTDAFQRVRCEGCFNPVSGTPTLPKLGLHDDTAPMVVLPVPPLRGAAQTESAQPHATERVMPAVHGENGLDSRDAT